MATRASVRRASNVVVAMLAVFVLTTLPALLPAVPLHASTAAAVGAPPAMSAASPSPFVDVAPSSGDGVIAYASRVTGDIHVMAPDGAGDRLLWTNPSSTFIPIDLAWRPNGRELAFTSSHEAACSWYDSDIFAIRPDGTGYRRITNSPACAVLATLPQGAVTISVDNYTSTPIWVYVAGAPEIKWISGSGSVLFDKVADFGPGVRQPCIGIGGLPRFVCYPPASGYPDVEPGKTLYGGNIVLMTYSGFRGFGPGKVSWKPDGSALAYVMRSNSEIDSIPAAPLYGQTGTALPVVENASPGLVEWGPTAATAHQYLYYTGDHWMHEGVGGIYLNSVGDASGGEMLVRVHSSDAQYVRDIEWLPDASGFLFSVFYVGLGYFTDIFEYNFTTKEITQLTHLPRDVDLVHALSISPDGRQVVLERVVDELDSDSSLWIMNIDGSDLRMLVGHAGRPAWGRIPPSITPRVRLPLLLR